MNGPTNNPAPENRIIDGYYARLAAAYVRGQARVSGKPSLSTTLLATPLGELTEGQQGELLTAGLAVGLPLYPFKRTRLLPRLAWTLGVLHGIQPASLLDIGSGRDRELAGVVPRPLFAGAGTNSPSSREFLMQYPCVPNESNGSIGLPDS